MSVEKTPLNSAELARLINKASAHPDGDIIKILRWTGMHPSVLCDRNFNLHEEKDEKGRPTVVWSRPKKTGKAARTSILKAKALDVDINTFVPAFQARKRKKSRQYIHKLVKVIGEDAGLSGISPMTLRHSVCVELLEKGIPEVTVRQLLNVGPKSMEHYAKYANTGRGDVLERVGW